MRGFFMRGEGVRKGQQHSGCGGRPVLQPLFSPLVTREAHFQTIRANWTRMGLSGGHFWSILHALLFIRAEWTRLPNPERRPGTGAAYESPQIQLGSTDWAPPSQNSFTSQKSPPSTCAKYKMYSVFFFGEALWPQVEYPLGTLCDSLAWVTAAMVKGVRGEAPRGVARICDK